MRKNDTIPTALGDLLVALGLLTRLPLRLPDSLYARGAKAAWAYPLAGAVLGALAMALAALLLALGLASGGVAVLVLVLSVLLNGAMHEDGLADCADGFWGGWEPARRLEIMKDSQIGSYGVLALGLVLLTRWWALSALLGLADGLWALPAVAMLSRAPMPLLMAALPHARANGLSHAQGRPTAPVAMLALALAGLGAFLCLGWPVLTLIGLLAGVTAAIALLAKAKIGGQTGDVLGACQQLNEALMLLVLTLLLG